MRAVPRIFVIGFNRCGTVSLHEFFKRSGLRSVHCDEGRLAVTMIGNALAGRRIIAGYECYDVFSDMYYACVHGIFEANIYFREIVCQEPDAKFILNVRDIDSWIKSRAYWYYAGMGPYPSGNDMECDPPSCRLELVESHMRHFGFTGPDQVFDDWRRQWISHVSDVREYIPPDRLLVFDVEKDDPVDLCRFAGIPDSSARHWKHYNKSIHIPVTTYLAKRIPWRIQKRVPRVIKDSTRFLMSRIEHGSRSIWKR